MCVPWLHGAKQRHFKMSPICQSARHLSGSALTEWGQLTFDYVISGTLMTCSQELFFTGWFIAAQRLSEAIQNVFHVSKCKARIWFHPQWVGQLSSDDMSSRALMTFPQELLQGGSLPNGAEHRLFKMSPKCQSAPYVPFEFITFLSCCLFVKLYILPSNLNGSV